MYDFYVSLHHLPGIAFFCIYSASLCSVLSCIFFPPTSQIRLVLYLYLLVVSLILAPEIFQDLKLFVWFSVGYK